MYLKSIKTALKDLLSCRSSSLISVAGLSIAFATVFFIYSRVTFELGYDTCHEKANRIYRISGEIKTAGSEAKHAVLGPYMGRGLKEHFPIVENYARLTPIKKSIILEREKTKISIDEAYFADSSVFQLFTFDFVHGDINTALAGPREVVVSHSLSQQLFGTENPIGKSIKEGDNLLTVTGVIKDLPKNSHHKLNVLISHPNPDTNPENESEVRLSEGYWMPSAYHFILLSPGAHIEEITENFDSFYTKYMSPFGEAINATFKPIAIPLKDLHFSSYMNYDYPKGNRIYSYFLIAVALFLILIAGINYSNLLVSRNITRSKSMGVRKILGAKNKMLYLHSLIGNLVYILVSLFVAFWLFLFIRQHLVSITGLQIADYPIGEIVVLSLIMVVAIGLLTSFIPWLNYVGKSGIEMIRPWQYLTGKSTFSFGRLSSILQYTLTIVLILSAVIMERQMRYLTSSDMGFVKENVLLVKLTDSSNEIKDVNFFREELLRNPDVEFASFSTRAPGEVLGTVHFPIKVNGEITTRIVNVMGIDLNYIPLMGMELLAGRNFDLSYNDGGFNTIIVNKAFIDFCGLKDDITGMQIGQTSVIGVLKDVSFNSLHNPAEPIVFYLTFEPTGYMNIRFRDADPGPAITIVQEVWDKVFGDAPADIQFLDNRVAMMYADDQRTSLLIRSFTLISIMLSIMGLINLTSIILKRKTKEIGIRKVNGAKIWQVMLMLNMDFVKWVTIAFVIATPIAYYAMDKWLQNFTYRTQLSLWVFALAGLLALAIALLTVSWQSWRAARRNPVEALRYE
ncbi:MAG: ABC transporter permease [Bacteroidales bacterium]